jgi:hypothetical protein
MEDLIELSKANSFANAVVLWKTRKKEGNATRTVPIGYARPAVNCIFQLHPSLRHSFEPCESDNNCVFQTGGRREVI